MKKGFSLVEIIISVGLIAIVMLFLFQILSDLQYEETSSNFAAGNQMNRANLIKKVEDDFNARFVKRVKLNQNDDNSVITISFQEGNSSTLTITPKTISYKNGNLEEGKNVFTYKIEDDNYEYDSDIKITSDLQSGNLTTVNLFCEDEDSNCGTSQFHYVKIRIPVKNIKTTDNNAQDDIELFYVGPFVENANKYKRFTLVSSALNTSLRIERISSKREEADLGEIRNGDFVYEQDELKISAEANTGYTNVLITVNDNILTGERIYKVKDNEEEGKVSVRASASLQEFRTTLQGNDELPVTIDRISSDKEGANKGIISIDDTLYYGDRLKISVGNPNEAQYENLSLKVNNASFESGREIVITSPLQISREASVRSYVQTIKTRFQNADGTWGEYSTAYEETKSYGDSVSYSVDANNTYAAASISTYQVTGPKTVQLDIPRRTSTNIIQVRYQNADGTYGAYSNAKSETLRVGETISWSRGEDATYVAASSSITATASNQTKQISVNRRTYALTVNKGTGISSVSGGGTYRAGQTVSISASMNSGYRFVNWTKNAGTLANANASSTTFTMPTSAATVTANGKINSITFCVLGKKQDKQTSTARTHNIYFFTVSADSTWGSIATTSGISPVKVLHVSNGDAGSVPSLLINWSVRDETSKYSSKKYIFSNQPGDPRCESEAFETVSFSSSCNRNYIESYGTSWHNAGINEVIDKPAPNISIGDSVTIPSEIRTICKYRTDDW